MRKKDILKKDKEKLFAIALRHDIILFGKEKVWEIMESFEVGEQRLYLRRIFEEVVKELEEMEDNNNEE